jgi:hypothetical protein
MRSRAALIVVLACLAVACGGDDGNGVTGPSNTPFTQTVTGTVSTFSWTRHPLTIPRAGQLTVRLTWTNGGADLDLYLAPTSCTDPYASGCTVLARSDAGSGTSEQVQRTVAAGESFNVFVDSFSSGPQSYSLLVTIQ